MKMENEMGHKSVSNGRGHCKEYGIVVWAVNSRGKEIR